MDTSTGKSKKALLFLHSFPVVLFTAQLLTEHQVKITPLSELCLFPWQ